MLNRIYPSLPTGFIFKSTVKVLISGFALFCGVETVTLNEKFYEKMLMPLIHQFVDAEQAHLWAVRIAKYGFLTASAETRHEYAELKCTVLDRLFLNPIGIAAGFDKNGEAVEGLRKCGLGFVEVGSVTPLPQPGNPQPRVFRLPEDKAVINRYGFNSEGVGVVHERLRAIHAPESDVPLGINLGKNKTSKSADHDYEIGAAYFAPLCDYLVVNVSSPNTPGLRALQSKKELVKILKTVQYSITRVTEFEGDHQRPPEQRMKRPKVLLKIAPDLVEDERRDIAKICLDRRNGVDGLIVTNTTVQRPDTDALRSVNAREGGGLSGQPLRDLSTECVSDMYRLTAGKVPIVGCGGVASGEDAYAKIRAGASLVQFYTALVYQGFPATGRIKRELAACLRRDGFANVTEAVGAAHRAK